MPVRVYSLNPEPLSRAAQLQPKAEIGPHGENLAIVLDRLRDDAPERFENLSAELHDWLPEFDRVLFETPQGGARASALRTAIGGHKVLAPDLSDGTLLAIAILTLAHLPEPPPLIGLEEPDHGIHPRLLRRVHDALHRLAYPEDRGESRPPVQVIATTTPPTSSTSSGTTPRRSSWPGRSRTGRTSSACRTGRTSRRSSPTLRSARSGTAAFWVVSPPNHEARGDVRVVGGRGSPGYSRKGHLPRARGWSGVLSSVGPAIAHLHYHTDADALIVVVDSDRTPVHTHEHQTSPDEACRLCHLKRVVRGRLAGLRERPDRSPIRCAPGMAVPSLEAWLLSGKDPGVGEAQTLATPKDPSRNNRYIGGQMRALYGTDRPSLSHETDVTAAEARRVVADVGVDRLRILFPGGFGPLWAALASATGERGVQ